MKELKSLKDFIETVEALIQSFEDIGLLIEMAYEENDESLVLEIEEELKSFETCYEDFRIQTLLSGEYVKKPTSGFKSIYQNCGG